MKHLDNNKDGLKEYQEISHKNSQKLKKMKQKIEFLKTFIDSEISKYSEQIKTTK